MTDATKPDSPGVKFPPPLLFVGGLLIAWLLETRWRHLQMFGPDFVSSARAIGYALVLAGLAIAAWGIITFKRAHTAIIPHNPASALVETGPYRFIRNPMYTGMTVQYVGGTLILDTGWALILLPIVLRLLFHFVVKREERYLSAEFGSTYDEYRGRVKRWI